MIESRHPRLNQNVWTTTTAVLLRQTGVITLCFSFCEDIKIFTSGACLKQQNQPNTGTTQYLTLVMVYQNLLPKQEPLQNTELTNTLIKYTLIIYTALYIYTQKLFTFVNVSVYTNDIHMGKCQFKCNESCHISCHLHDMVCLESG